MPVLNRVSFVSIRCRLDSKALGFNEVSKLNPVKRGDENDRIGENPTSTKARFHGVLLWLALCEPNRMMSW